MKTLHVYYTIETLGDPGKAAMALGRALETSGYSGKVDSPDGCIYRFRGLDRETARRVRRVFECRGFEVRAGD